MAMTSYRSPPGTVLRPTGRLGQSCEYAKGYMTPQAPGGTKERNSQEQNPGTLGKCRTKEQAALAVPLQTRPQSGRNPRPCP